MSAAELAMEIEEAERDKSREVFITVAGRRVRVISCDDGPGILAAFASSDSILCVGPGTVERAIRAMGAAQGVASRLVAPTERNIHGPEKNRG